MSHFNDPARKHDPLLHGKTRRGMEGDLSVWNHSVLLGFTHRSPLQPHQRWNQNRHVINRVIHYGTAKASPQVSEVKWSATNNVEDERGTPPPVTEEQSAAYSIRAEPWRHRQSVFSASERRLHQTDYLQTETARERKQTSALSFYRFPPMTSWRLRGRGDDRGWFFFLL